MTFRSWSDYEDQTEALRVWTPGIVDGLVQTQAYAAALIATSPGVSDDAAAARLTARIERQRRVLGRDKPPAVTSWSTRPPCTARWVPPGLAASCAACVK